MKNKKKQQKTEKNEILWAIKMSLQVFDCEGKDFKGIAPEEFEYGGQYPQDGNCDARAVVRQFEKHGHPRVNVSTAPGIGLDVDVNKLREMFVERNWDGYIVLNCRSKNYHCCRITKKN